MKTEEYKRIGCVDVIRGYKYKKVRITNLNYPLYPIKKMR